VLLQGKSRSQSITGTTSRQVTSWPTTNPNSHMLSSICVDIPTASQR